MRYIFIGTPKIYTTTGLGPRKNREMAGVDDWVVYIQTAVFYISLYIHHPGGASRPGASVVFYSSLHIHHQIVHTSHSPIFSRPKPGGGVYLWVPNYTLLRLYPHDSNLYCTLLSWDPKDIHHHRVWA